MPDKRPTIGHSREMGLTGFHAYCMILNSRNIRGCDRNGRVTFDQTRLPDSTAFLNIPRCCRLICKRCGVRSFDIFPDWRDMKVSDGTWLREFMAKRQTEAMAAWRARQSKPDV